MADSDNDPQPAALASPPVPVAGGRGAPSRRPFKQLLREEWGLALLAIVLSAIVYTSVRRQVESDHTLPVRVRLVTPPEAEFEAVLADPDQIVELALYCSRPEFVEAESAVKAQGGIVDIMVTSGTDGDDRSLSIGYGRGSLDILELPFSRDLLVDRDTPPRIEGRVFKFIEFQLEVGAPRIEGLDPQSYRVEFADITPTKVVAGLQPASLRTVLPDLTLQPDPISQRMIEENGEVIVDRSLSLPLSFSNLRTGDRYDPRRLMHVPDPGAYKVIVVIRKVASALIANRLRLSPELEGYDIQIIGDAEDADIRTGGAPLGAPGSRSTLQAELFGTVEDIEALKANLSDWSFELGVRDPANLPTAAGEPGTVTATLKFFAGPRFQERGITLKLSEFQNELQLGVTRRE